MDELELLKDMMKAGWITYKQYKMLYNQEGWKDKVLKQRNKRFRERNKASIVNRAYETNARTKALDKWRDDNPKQYAESKWRQYCNEPLENIENYELAEVDGFRGWIVHHRLETHTPEGKKRTANISKSELIALDMYFNRSAGELICLRSGDHTRLHFAKLQ